jgi:Ig-like domain from next to BRCA1 gene
MRKWHVFLVILVLAGLLATTSCSQSQTPVLPQASPSPAVLILDLKITPSESPTEVRPVPTATAVPNPLPPKASPTATNPVSKSPVYTSTSTTPVCTLRAAFIKHLTVNDNTAFMPGISFGKMWRIQNAGTCTWSTNYTLVFTGGDPMSSPASIPLPHEVKPGETVDLRVSMIAPETPKVYSGQWMLRAPSGETFGVGEAADQALVVSIVVRAPGSSGGYANKCT